MKLANAILVDFKRFVVESGQPIAPSARELAQKLKRFRKRLRLLEHELLELISRVGALPVKHGPAQVLIKCRPAALKSTEHELVPVLEIGPVQVELLDRSSPRAAIPSVRQYDASIVPKQ